MRALFVIIELSVLIGCMFCLLLGTWLTLLDMGLKPKYRMAVLMPVMVIGGVGVTFFIAHLLSFYPSS